MFGLKFLKKVFWSSVGFGLSSVVEVKQVFLNYFSQNFESWDYEMCSKTSKKHEIYICIASTGSSFTPIHFLPPFCVVDVEWWVEDQLVIEESFNLKAKSSGTLQPQFWKMGQTVRDFPENSFFSNLLLFYNSSWTETHTQYLPVLPCDFLSKK